MVIFGLVYTYNMLIVAGNAVLFYECEGTGSQWRECQYIYTL